MPVWFFVSEPSALASLLMPRDVKWNKVGSPLVEAIGGEWQIAITAPFLIALGTNVGSSPCEDAYSSTLL